MGGDLTPSGVKRLFCRRSIYLDTITITITCGECKKEARDTTSVVNKVIGEVITMKCTKCGAQLVVTEVTGGPHTSTYKIGCKECGLDDSGGTVQSLGRPKPGNANTTVDSL
jgi:hypothetical protein